MADKLQFDSGISVTKFNENFFTMHGYSLLVEGSQPNVHATSCALSVKSLLTSQIAISKKFIHSKINDKSIFECVTQYFPYFVARGFAETNAKDGLLFIEKYYGPMARKYGTIQEKVSDEASLAHGLSIAIASLISG